MKKYYRTCLSLLICMMLIVSLTSAASASVVSWSDNEGGKNLTLTITEWSNRQIVVSNPRKFYHSVGTITDLSTYGPFTATINVERTKTSYESKLVEAMMLEGLRTSYTISGNFNQDLHVPKNDPSGYYTLGVLFDTGAGYWKVSKGMIMPKSPNALNPGVEHGTLYYAPRGTVHGYVAVPVP